jgi:uncharacterized protein (TIGR02246 family)
MFASTRLTIAALLLAASACKPAPRTETAGVGAGAAVAGLSAQDEAAIHAVDAAWAKAASAGDANAIAALYTPDATLLPPSEPAHTGDIAKYFAGFTDPYTIAMELNTLVVEGRDDLAYVVGSYKMTLTPKQAGAKPLPTEEGKYMEVLKKQGDGSWKMVYDMWSPNAPAKS